MKKVTRNLTLKEITAYILRLIADGLEKDKAIKNASSKFGVSEKSISRFI